MPETLVPPPPSRGPLDRLRVLVTRPAAQSQNLCALLERAGAIPLRLPLFGIEPLTAGVAERLAAARRFDWWIFTSANAAEQTLKLDREPWPALAAAGAATARVLREAQRGEVVVPADQDGAPGLLALPEFADLAGRRILIVTGADGPPALVDGLRARGAEVGMLAVYRRVPVLHAAQFVAAAVHDAQAAIVTSGEALQRLVQLTPPALRPRLLRVQLVLPSARVVELARESGFVHPPLLPARVADTAFVQALLDWRGTSSKNV